MIIFQCYGGTHTSVTAAFIYLGRLPRSRVPLLQELLELPYFDRVPGSGIGTLNYAGCDRQQNHVFVLGSGRWRTQIRGLLSSFIQFHGSEKPGVALIDCSAAATWTVRAGGFVSRRLGLTALGRPLVGRGILGAYPVLLRMVEHFENNPASYFL